ncbi:uncharacterized protein LOC130975921 [Arachis stenosperma]|uniref:uncharacterized protein LOC130975921 n=1 Tax=Arachis stenosperma TaxID=217475 RepID=UPI0025ACA65C|nr:uncharacterized protein LOC130975921 [Arachis stenosperma]
MSLIIWLWYDGSQDDYIVVVAYKGKDGENYFDLCCLRSNSWINLDAALPKSLYWDDWKPMLRGCSERSFSKISVPIERDLCKPRLVLLGGCLALYVYEENTTEIWVMKEYKVQSSWTLYEIPLGSFKPMCLSANGDIIGRCYPSDGEIEFYIYNVRGEPLKHVQYVLYGEPSNHMRSVVHVDCLMAVPSNIKQKKRKKGSQNHKQVKQGKESRSKYGNNLDT